MTRRNQRPDETTDTNATREPITRVKLFPVEAAIWRNSSKDGEPFYAVTFGRAYRDREGQWKNSSNFSGDDLLTLAKAADLAHSRIVELRAADRQADEPDA
jgi:hypothetical protein